MSTLADIGPNTASIILGGFTLLTVVINAVITHLGNRKTKALVDAVDVKVQKVADGMQTKMVEAKEEAAAQAGKLEQVQTERAVEQAQAVERVLQAGDVGRELGRAEAKADSGPVPLDKPGALDKP